MTTLTLLGDAAFDAATVSGAVSAGKVVSDSGIISNATNGSWYTIFGFLNEGTSIFVVGGYLVNRSGSACAIVTVDNANGYPNIIMQGSGDFAAMEFRADTYNLQLRFTDGGVNTDMRWNYLKIG